MDMLDNEATLVALREAQASPVPASTMWRRIWLAIGLVVLRLELVHPRIVMPLLNAWGGGTPPTSMTPPQLNAEAIRHLPAFLGLQILKVALVIGLHLYGIWRARRRWREAHPDRFTYAYATLSCSVGLHTAVLGMLIYSIVFQSVVMWLLEGFHLGMYADPPTLWLPWVDLVFLIAMELYCLSRVRVYLDRLAQPESPDAESPAQ